MRGIRTCTESVSPRLPHRLGHPSTLCSETLLYVEKGCDTAQIG